MKRIATLTDRKVLRRGGFSLVKPRMTARAILKNREGLYAVMYSEKFKLYSLPGGGIEPGETPAKALRRELLEETGTVAGNFFSLGKLYPTPGYTDEVIYMYGATELSFGNACPDEDEFLSLERIPLSRAVEMVMDGTLTDAKTQTAILKLDILRKEGRI